MFDAENLRRELFKLSDEDYRAFQAKIVPNVTKENFMGIRTPNLNRFVKEYFQAADAESFLNDLPHKYFEENSIHALLISALKDFGDCLNATKNFLPYVDNWATCDSITPKIFKRHVTELYAEISTWLASEHVYTVRFGLNMLRTFYLDENFDVKYLERVAAVEARDYYVEMMAAWLFATALVKHFDATIPFLTGRKLTPRLHNRTIRKALESRRIAAEQKTFLRGLRI